MILNDVYRIIDANANRVAEGLRVVEDWFRFTANDAEWAARVKLLRHGVRDTMQPLSHLLLAGRQSENDVGFTISQAEAKTGTADSLLPANFKRAQEGLRVIEENLRRLGYDELARQTEQRRFAVYTLEKSAHERWLRLQKSHRLATDLYGITAYEYSNGRSNEDVVKAMLEAGIKLIQYREKERHPGIKLRECDAIRRLTREAQATLIINDHPDLALMVEADGVHIGQDDWPPERVRQIIGPEMILGLSTHSPEQAAAAMKLPVDYIGVGPIFATRTKKDVCSPVGLDYLDYAVKNVPLPFVAIGGIKGHNLGEVLQHGARCVALVTEIVGATSIVEKIHELRQTMEKGMTDDEL